MFVTSPRAKAPKRAPRDDFETQTPPSLAPGFIGRTIVIEGVTPELDAGRFPVKRVVWDRFEVGADIYKEGHDVLAAAVRYRPHDVAAWQEVPLAYSYERDRWSGSFVLERNVRYLYTVTAWTDRYGTWSHDVSRKFAAGQDIALELTEGRALVGALRGRAKGRDRAALEAALSGCERATDAAARLGALLSSEMAALAARYEAREDMVRYERVLEVVADRPAARFSAWYEMFPRSQGDDPLRGGTFEDAARRLPAIAALGFDVVYLPPIHPIGVSFRKGRNNTLGAGPNDPGSPWAIGNEHGGHMSVDPGLGTLEDFRRFVAAARARGMEVALDYALQCSPDHPYVKTHPEWFAFRPDGSIRYAENPPKKYQDIVNFDWTTRARKALWKELRDIVLFWIGQGVRIFRVDNPHTKPVAFWRWLIRDIQNAYPETIFLSEAFTRPKALHMLAKAGFTQSYSYFTWRNSKAELMEYLVEITQAAGREYLRPNFFANTPDILPPYLQTGGRPAFLVRLVLAATLSSAYGIYSGYEICESEALPGREEYANSEKYEIKVRDYAAAGNINAEIAAVNRIRRENRALHDLLTLRFYHASNDRVLWYAKATSERDNVVFVAVNLDPFDTVESELELPFADLGLAPEATLEVEELLTARRVRWSGGRGWVRLDPQHNPAEIFRVVTTLPPGGGG